MKKLIIPILVMLALAGCSTPTKTTEPVKAETTKAETTKAATSKEVKLKLENQEAKGNAKVEIVNQSGSSEGGKTITILGDYAALQIGLNAENFDGSKFTYVFVDGKENSKHQFGEMSQTSITLEGDALKPGIHNVEVIQWAEDGVKGEVLQYKIMKYEVKK